MDIFEQDFITFSIRISLTNMAKDINVQPQKTYMASMDVGSPAPEFTLKDTDLKDRKLSEFRGKNLVLAFFPGAFTGVCTTELCRFRDDLSKLAGLGGQILGVSVDSPFANMGFANAHNLSFPILSDYKRDVIRNYGLELPDFAGMDGYTAAKRSVFVLDSGGVIRYKWISDDPTIEPNYVEVEDAVSRLQ